jgi:cytochrome oxidase Cu insertion factor (SCO1/SenC/PrrC family)
MPKPRRLSRPRQPKPRLWWPALLLLTALTAGTLLLAALVPVPPAPVTAEASPLVPRFSLTNQEGRRVDNQVFAGKYYVTDFFFASCPSICPRMQQQLSQVYTRFRYHPRLLLLSHTIDPAHDSVPVLRAYAHRLGVPTARQWHFATASHRCLPCRGLTGLAYGQRLRCG